ncbi:hypothetical protein G7K_5690-t1 [Saitoella complicata NRRL Y-17804]|uniref:Uncharacterized protein n=1 Tax=Saitoella complicata (strain BCRC 22490 / CBS 7301 / JCM 7358 / NBRC 10748 / NRRL Y-17804) TaxID=698492 RepID=A0A0E9NPJ1_SAICN|nr:hypothetical protein G7K_5690-t1 [Saitoella complicata NRRL Y-17804]
MHRRDIHVFIIIIITVFIIIVNVKLWIILETAIGRCGTHQNKRRHQARVSRLNNHHVNLSATAIMCPVWVDTIQAIASGEQMGEDQGGVGFDAFVNQS